jgi:predicted DNA-binding transcriptional regulator AlpA
MLARRILRTPEAAQYLGLSQGTLEKFRVYGGGPRWCRIGRRIVGYRIDDLDAFIERGYRRSTSDPGTDEAA